MSCRISDRRTGISGRDYMYRMRCRPLQFAAYRGVRGLCGGAVPGQHGAVQLLDLSRWLCHRYAGGDRRCELHGVCGRAVQRCSYVSVCTMRGRLRDRCCGGLRCRELHGVCSGAVQPCVDIGVHGVRAGVGDGRVGKRGGDLIDRSRARRQQTAIWLKTWQPASQNRFESIEHACMSESQAGSE